MKVHTLDIDSGERDPVLYSNPSDYVVHLKNPIYDVTKISLISARIHNSQYLIHSRNNQFDVLTNGGSTQTVTIPIGNYSGEELAEAINTNCTIITGATFDKDTNAITFTGSSDFTFLILYWYEWLYIWYKWVHHTTRCFRFTCFKCIINFEFIRNWEY